MNTKPQISMVIPVYNESGNIDKLYNELTAALTEIGRTYEVITIDDGSKDDTFAKLKAVHERDPRWQVVRFRRNFGQTAAMSAGFHAASAPIVITIDADLQNDPRDIRKILDTMEAGSYDIVSGWRQDRKEPFFSRRLPSMMANRIIARTTGVTIHDYGCTLKAYRNEVVKHIQLYGELHRFIPALASSVGVTVAEVPVSDRARTWGKSKYNFTRTFRVMLDLLTVNFLLGYSTRPIHVFGGLGLVSGGLGVVIGLYLTFIRLVLGQDIGERPLLLLAVLLVILGVQMISIGLVAEMVTRTYYEAQQKPIYMVREWLHSDKPSYTTNGKLSTQERLRTPEEV